VPECPATLPRFEDYPVQEKFKGPPAKPVLSSEEAKLFRTLINEGAKTGPDFAGHYTAVIVGCGTSCGTLFIVDAKNGRVFYQPDVDIIGYNQPELDYDKQYGLNSRLMIAFKQYEPEESDDIIFYEWKNDQFSPICKKTTRKNAKVHSDNVTSVEPEQSLPPNREFRNSAIVDLNGDSQVDNISLSSDLQANTFTLKINDASITEKLIEQGESPQGFYVVDLDKSDRYKEISVSLYGGCDPCGTEYVYSFDKGIKKIAHLPPGPSYLGNGIVLSVTWMDFWTPITKYALDKKSGILNEVPQSFYYVGLTSTVKTSFPLYRGQHENTSELVANLKPGSKILVLAAEYKKEPKWYLVKSESGLLGWTKGEKLTENTEGLPSAG